MSLPISKSTLEWQGTKCPKEISPKPLHGGGREATRAGKQRKGEALTAFAGLSIRRLGVVAHTCH